MRPKDHEQVSNVGMPLRRVAASVVMLTACLAITVVAQSPRPRPAANGVIIGRVVDAATGAPVRGATVRVNSYDESEGEEPSTATGVITGADGQFVFGGLAPANYLVAATRFGYSRGSAGQHRPRAGSSDGSRITLAQNEVRTDVTVRVWKLGAIAGTVVDEYGQPLTGVQIHAFPRAFVSGRPTLAADAEDARTDDRGRYRISGLVPGDYIVGIIYRQATAPRAMAAEAERAGRTGDREAMLSLYMDAELAGMDMPRLGDSGYMSVGPDLFAINNPPASLRNGRWFVYPSQFYGGSPLVASSRVITVGSGEDASAIDFTMRPVASVRVSGTVTGPTGPMAGMPVRLTLVGSGEFQVDHAAPGIVSMTDTAGRFTMLGVTPGEYVLSALKGPTQDGMFGIVEASGSNNDGSVISVGGEMWTGSKPKTPTPTFFATSTLTVGDADIDGVSLTLRNGVRLSGRLEFSGTSDKPAGRQQFYLHVERRDGTAAWQLDTTAAIGKDEKFETAELPSGFYFFRASEVVGPWRLESITANGVDISDVPFEISDKPIGSIVARFTDKPSQLSGVVRPAGGERPDDALALVFPADSARWKDYGESPRGIRQLTIAKDGTFSTTGLPAGNYLVAAVHDDFITNWRDPAFLAKLASFATRVSLTRGDQKTVTLDVGRVR